MNMTFSVIINTYNRARNLATTLRALELLRHPTFEIIVVNGPSADDTEAVLAPYLGRIKYARCPEANLGRSRNIGLRHAAGDIVCFTDDDGIPEPDWLDALESAYQSDPRLGAAGGFVRDHTGVSYQSRYIVCDRAGNATFHDTAEAAGPALLAGPGAPRYPSLMGVNSSFRRQALLAIGGFDEEYAYLLDETDVCLRLIDAGWHVRFVPSAQVHHKYAPSHLRSERRIPTSLYYTTRSKVYFIFRHALPDTPPLQTFQTALHARQNLLADIARLRTFGTIDAAHHATLQDDILRGTTDGIRDAHAHPAGRLLSPAERTTPPPAFHTFPTRLPASARRRLLLITQDYPPRPCGGIGVFMHRLASALADAGHECTVITRAEGDQHTVDLEEGIWVHRLPLRTHEGRTDPAIPPLPPTVRDWTYTVYDEARRIQALRGPHITLSAVWDLEALACIASGAFPLNAVYLVTTYQLNLPNKPEWQGDPDFLQGHVNKMIAAERWLYRHPHARLIASTPGIWRDLRHLNPDLPEPAHPVPIIPFGLPPAPDTLPPRPADHSPPGALTLLYVGRFEHRKGIDLLLDALPELLDAHPQLYVRLVGNDRLPADPDGTPYKDRFLARHGEHPAVRAGRVRFLGVIDDDALLAEYAHCDLFVAPSRYESFGLIYLEAMRWGKPCIGTLVGGIPDVLPAEAGLLVPPSDRSALIQAIDRLLRDPGLRARLGAAGLERFRQHYTVQAFLARLLDWVDDALTNAP